MWEFLRSLLELVQEAIRAGDATIRLALVVCLMIVMLWVLAKIIQ
jgi:hypothetical protein